MAHTVKLIDYEVEISVDQQEAQEFCAWLNARGHHAEIGNSTESYIDNARTSTDENASKIMTALWKSYCQSV